MNHAIVNGQLINFGLVTLIDVIGVDWNHPRLMASFNIHLVGGEKVTIRHSLYIYQDAYNGPSYYQDLASPKNASPRIEIPLFDKRTLVEFIEESDLYRERMMPFIMLRDNVCNFWAKASHAFPVITETGIIG